MRRLRLKVEINTREHFTVYGHQTQRLAVESRWFAASADVRTFHLDELLGTKLCALYQRRYGRDLFDLWDARRRGEMNPARVVEVFLAYLKANDLRVTRAEFERNLAAKARNRLFLEEVTPLLAPGITYDARAAMDLVQREFIQRLPGDAWKGG